jgi:hypothetical protein
VDIGTGQRLSRDTGKWAGVIAFALSYALFGLVFVALGVSTYRRAGELTEANKAITERFFPGRVGRAVDASVGSPTAYRIGGAVVVGVGVLALLISLGG